MLGAWDLTGLGEDAGWVCPFGGGWGGRWMALVLENVVVGREGDAS